jgi:hypothetical protein
MYMGRVNVWALGTFNPHVELAIGFCRQCLTI